MKEYSRRDIITKERVWQGEVLDPILFNAAADEVMKEIQRQIRKLQVGYKDVERIWLYKLAIKETDGEIWKYGKCKKENFEDEYK